MNQRVAQQVLQGHEKYCALEHTHTHTCKTSNVRYAVAANLGQHSRTKEEYVWNVRAHLCLDQARTVGLEEEGVEVVIGGDADPRD